MFCGPRNGSRENPSPSMLVLNHRNEKSISGGCESVITGTREVDFRTLCRDRGSRWVQSGSISASMQDMQGRLASHFCKNLIGLVLISCVETRLERTFFFSLTMVKRLKHQWFEQCLMTAYRQGTHAVPVRMGFRVLLSELYTQSSPIVVHR